MNHLPVLLFISQCLSSIRFVQWITCALDNKVKVHSRPSPIHGVVHVSTHGAIVVTLIRTCIFTAISFSLSRCSGLDLQKILFIRTEEQAHKQKLMLFFGEKYWSRQEQQQSLIPQAPIVESTPSDLSNHAAAWHNSGPTHLPFTYRPAFPIRSGWLPVSESVSKKGEMERGQETLGEVELKWIVSTLGLVCFCNEVSYLVWWGVCCLQCVFDFWLFFFFNRLFAKYTFHILSLWRLLYCVSTCFVRLSLG